MTEITHVSGSAASFVRGISESTHNYMIMAVVLIGLILIICTSVISNKIQAVIESVQRVRAQVHAPQPRNKHQQGGCQARVHHGDIRMRARGRTHEDENETENENENEL